MPTLLTRNADMVVLRVALENLLRNAWKFTGKQPRARIEFGVTEREGTRAYFVRDDGAGLSRLTPTSCSAPSSACTGLASSRVRA